MRGRGSGGLNGAGGGVQEEGGRGYMSDRGKGRERESEGGKVEVANLVPCCISPSHPCRKRRRRGGGRKVIAFIYQTDLSAAVAVSCCGTSYLTLNELSECLPQQVNKSVIPLCGRDCHVNVGSIK